MKYFSTLSDDAFVRLPSIIGPSGALPIGKSTFWRWIAMGRLPKPYKLGRSSAWKVGELRIAIAAFKQEG